MKGRILLQLGIALGTVALWQQLKPLRASTPFWTLREKPGTALITGASRGIGAAYARNLIAKGYDLILVARDQDKLMALAEELSHRYPTRTEVLIADLASERGIEQVVQRIETLDSLSLLINNAGFGTNGNLAEIDLQKQLDMLQVHMEAPVRFSRAALPGFIQQRHGAIINVSSIAAFFYTGGNTNYCASKAFLNTFSESLQLELQNTGVTVQNLCPGFTYSEFHDTEEYANFSRSQIPSFFWMTASDVVTESLNALGYPRSLLIPGYINRLIVLSAKLGVGSTVSQIVRQTMGR